MLYDPRTHYAFEKLPKSAVEEVVLEEIPDTTYEQLVGLLLVLLLMSVYV